MVNWNKRFSKMSSWICLFVLFDIFLVLVVAQTGPIVTTKSGPVRGKVSKTVVKKTNYLAFVGIPYAEPPLGELRFKPPVPIKPWTSIHDATIEGNVCPQIDLFTQNFTGHEDCLFINVFTPVIDLEKKPKNLKAVMVWIYGGGFKAGSSNTSLYGPDFLIEHDVVVVTFNYRLGPLGFLSLNHPNATGNAGLKDQNLALRWVKSNIKNFGGDPQRITIFGQSAGSVSVDYHVLSDISKGLFHNAISMSGSPYHVWGFQTIAKSVELGEKLAELVGYKSASPSKDYLLSYFRKVSPYDFVMADAKMGGVIPAFKPTLENPDIAEGEIFISECARTKYARGNYSKVPQIMGVMAEESLSFLGAVSTLRELIDHTIWTQQSIGGFLSPFVVDADKFFTFPAIALNETKNLAREDLITETTDILFKYGVNEKQKSLISSNLSPLYYYEITFAPNNSMHKQWYNVNLRGAGHADELAYIFYIPAADLPLDPKDPISIMRDRMTRMWTNFAKYGNPTPDGTNDPILNITWPGSSSTGTHLKIDEKLSIGDRLINPNVKFIETLGASTARVTNGCPNIARSILEFLTLIKL